MAVTYEPIATTTLGSAASSIDFTSIPGTYTDLRVVVVGTSSSSGVNFNLRFNSDSGSNYSLTSMQGNGSSVTSNISSNVSQMFLSYTGYSSTVPSLTTIDVLSYTKAINKVCLVTGSEDRNGSGSVDRRVGLWRNTGAITSINLLIQSGTLNVGTTATLYGIKAA